MASAIGAPFPAAFNFWPPPGLTQSVPGAHLFMSSPKKPKNCSPSKQRRDFARGTARRDWVQRTAARKTACENAGDSEASHNHPEEQTRQGFGNLEQAIAHVLEDDRNPFSRYFQQWMGGSPSVSTSRQREIFPLSPVRTWLFKIGDGSILPVSLRLLMLNACIAGMNFLAADFNPARIGQTTGRHTAAQLDVLQHVAERVSSFLEVLFEASSGQLSVCNAFGQLEERSPDRYPKLRAEAVDLPAVAGTCDPSLLIPTELAAATQIPSALFAGRQTEVGPHTPFRKDEKLQYVNLVWRQLQCGKTRLRIHVDAIGGVFCVAKSNGRQREVWDGSLVSAGASRPPAPARLANPSCFVDLQFVPGQSVYMSKRDVHTCFDILHAPDALQPYFGRPPITLQELARVSKLTVSDLQQFVVDRGDGVVGAYDMVYPASTVWPMGFSWSSCIAQAATLACCVKAGVCTNSFMDLDSPPPSGPEICGVATDDTFFFHFDKEMGRKRLSKLDAVLAENGMPKNATKDVSLQTSMTALGCCIDATTGTAEPEPSKITALFLAWIDLLNKRQASPRSVSRALGLHQWFCLLQRPAFCVLDTVYEFARREPSSVSTELPSSVGAELAVAAFIMPLLYADLRRTFLPQLTACDAAPAFGFGVAYMKCSRAAAAGVGALAERRGDYVKFYLGPDEPPPKDRLGVPHLLPYAKQRFKVAISARARYKAHSGVLEAHGLLLALKWLLRKRGNFHHRLAFLIDAKAVLGATSKGRSSAPVIRGIVRQIGALLMATNCLFRGIYVPSEHNPADEPSRGKWHRRDRTRKVQKSSIQRRRRDPSATPKV